MFFVFLVGVGRMFKDGVVNRLFRGVRIQRHFASAFRALKGLTAVS